MENISAKSQAYSCSVDRMECSLFTNNKKVLDFYKEHTSLNFEEMNILLVDILNKLVAEVSPNMDSKFALSIINEMKNINSSISKTNNDNIINFDNKFMEFKKEYIHNLTLIINNNNSENIKPLLVEYNQILQDKIKIGINEIVPQNNEKIAHEINNSFRDINKSVNELIILNNKNEELNTKVDTILNKFNNSSSKGNMSEQVIFNLMKTIYSTTHLKYVGNIKENGDILLDRPNKTKIIIENKDYAEPVDQKEVDKFIKNINTQNCSGVFLSQNSKIVNKTHFQINFYGNNIGIYIAENRYDTDMIQIGVNIIDDIKLKIGLHEINEETFQIESNELDNINKEYNIFIVQKLNHIKTIKEFSKKLIDEVEQMNIPTLHYILDKNYGSDLNKDLCCKLCNFVGKNKLSLASHTKAHTNKNTMFIS